MKKFVTLLLIIMIFVAAFNAPAGTDKTFAGTIKDAGEDARKELREVGKEIEKKGEDVKKDLDKTAERIKKEIGKELKKTDKDAEKGFKNTLKTIRKKAADAWNDFLECIGWD